jgi:hypothetical protein
LRSRAAVSCAKVGFEEERRMSLFRTFLAIVVLTASGAAMAEPPAKAPEKATDKKAEKAPEKAADKAPEKTADKAADKKAADKPREEVSDDLAQRFVAFFDKLTTIVVAHKQDCAKMAAEVNAHVDANQPLLKQVAEAKEQHKTLPQATKDRIAKKSAEELAPAMMVKCSSDRIVTNAFLRIRSASEK